MLLKEIEQKEIEKSKDSKIKARQGESGLALLKYLFVGLFLELFS